MATHATSSQSSATDHGVPELHSDKDGSLLKKDNSDGGVEISSFTEDVQDGSLHIQIISLQRQIYVWIGYNSSKFGNLYAAAPTGSVRASENSISVASILGGSATNSGSTIARRLVLKTGLNIVLACHLPKDSPMLEASAERILVQKLKALGLIKPK